MAMAFREARTWPEGLRLSFNLSAIQLCTAGAAKSVLRALKQRWPESEVIIITGYPTLESAKEAVALGADDYLTKPVGPEQVIDASNAAMQHKRWALHNDSGARAVNAMARGS